MQQAVGFLSDGGDAVGQGWPADGPVLVASAGLEFFQDLEHNLNSRPFINMIKFFDTQQSTRTEKHVWPLLPHSHTLLTIINEY